MHPLPVVVAAGFPRAEIQTTRDKTFRPWEPDQQMKKLLKLAEDGIRPRTMPQGVSSKSTPVRAHPKAEQAQNPHSRLIIAPPLTAS